LRGDPEETTEDNTMRLLSQKELMERLGVSDRWLKAVRERKDDPLPHYRLSGRRLDSSRPGTRTLRYDWDAVERWMARQTERDSALREEMA
jgi:predicted DNA-binding transcriptional regulator AlpA